MMENAQGTARNTPVHMLDVLHEEMARHHRWGFPKIGDPKIVPQIILRTPKKRYALILGNSQMQRRDELTQVDGDVVCTWSHSREANGDGRT